MKTIEDKAKAYDEVLNKLRHFIAKGVDPLITRADVQDFFPELAESEGEKVRKALLEMVHDTTGDELWVDYNVHKEEALSWLERQGEHANFLSKIQVGDKVTRNEAGVLVNLLQLKRVAKPSEEQEQKASYTTIVKTGDGGINALVTLPIEMKTAEESLGIDSDTYNKIVDECILGEPKTKENKGNIRGISANWSEEDECYMSECIEAIATKEGWSFEEKRKTKHWLQSLKGRVGCEANCTTTKEWSDDDKRKIDRIYSILRQAADTHAFSTSCRLIGDKECMELQDWLKSLRPQNTYNPYKAVVESIAEMCKHYDKASHSGLRDFYDNVKVKCKEAKEYDKMFPQTQWKPSDEQMSLLQAIINEPNNAASESCQIVLREVLEQLKKLKEGKV